MGKRTYSVFYKYLISFFVVALLPIGIGVASFYQYNVQSLRRQTLDISGQKFKQTSQLVDNVIYDHFRMASALVAEPLLQSNQLLGDSYTQYQSLSYIKPYLTRNQDMEKSYVVMKANDTVYSSGGVMSLETLCSIVLQWSEEQTGELEEILKDNREHLDLGDTIDRERLIFIHPIPTYRPYANLLFFMERDAIQKTFSEGLESENQRLFMMTGEGEILLSDFSDHETEAMKELLLHPLEENGDLKEDFREQELHYYRSEATDLIYAGSFMTDGGFMKEMERQRNIMIVVCFLMMFLCMGLAFGVASFTYKPIRDLLGLLDKPVVRRNEMTALYEYIESQKELTHSIHWQTPYVQQRIMELYLEGLIDETEQKKAFGSFCFSGERNCYFAVVLVLKCRNGNSTSHYRQEILNLSLEMEIKKNLHICHIENFNDSDIVWIVNAQEKEPESKTAMELLGALKGLFSEGSSLQYGVGIGRNVKELKQIRDSYYEALAAAEYLQGRGVNKILFYRDLAKTLTQEEMPDGDNVLKLVQALRKGDRTSSLELFSEHSANLDLKYKSVILNRYFVVQFYKVLVDALKEYVPDEYLEELSRLAVMEDQGGRIGRAQQLIEKICNYRTVTQKSRQVDLAGKILDYIMENALQPTLSLEQLGDEFGLSPYYISRFMTEQTGDNLKNYIAGIRIEEAKKLLAETTLPLYEIVVRIGYLDVSSFIRKFKKTVGMTPGEYREKEQKNEHDAKS